MRRSRPEIHNAERFRAKKPATIGDFVFWAAVVFAAVIGVIAVYCFAMIATYGI